MLSGQPHPPPRPDHHRQEEAESFASNELESREGQFQAQPMAISICGQRFHTNMLPFSIIRPFESWMLRPHHRPSGRMLHRTKEQVRVISLPSSQIQIFYRPLFEPDKWYFLHHWVLVIGFQCNSQIAIDTHLLRLNPSQVKVKDRYRFCKQRVWSKTLDLRLTVSW